MSRRRRELIQAKRALCYGNGDLSDTLRCLMHDRCPAQEECEQAGACIAEAEQPDETERATARNMEKPLMPTDDAAELKKLEAMCREMLALAEHWEGTTASFGGGPAALYLRRMLESTPTLARELLSRLEAEAQASKQGDGVELVQMADGSLSLRPRPTPPERRHG